MIIYIYIYINFSKNLINFVKFLELIKITRIK